MIISDEQARLAAHYLRSTARDTSAPHRPEVSPELLHAVEVQLAECPECRLDRVQEAAARVDAGLDPHDVAEKMISRIVSDAIR